MKYSKGMKNSYTKKKKIIGEPEKNVKITNINTQIGIYPSIDSVQDKT